MNVVLSADPVPSAKHLPLPSEPSPARPAQATPAQARPGQPSPAQPSPAQPSPAHPNPAQRGLSQLSPDQPCPAQAQPSPAHGVGRAKTLPNVFLVLDLEVPFAAPRRLRFWSVFGSFLAAVPLRFAVLERQFLGPFFAAFPAVSLSVSPWPQLSPAQPSPSQLSQTRPAQPSPAQPSPAQPSPAQRAAHSPCQSFAKVDLEVPFAAPRQLRFWSVFGSFGAAVPLRFAVLERRFWDFFLLLSQACPCSFGLGPSSAQPSPSQLSPAAHSPSLGVGRAKALPKAFLYWI